MYLAFSTHVIDNKYGTKVRSGTLKGRDHFEDLHVEAGCYSCVLGFGLDGQFRCSIPYRTSGCPQLRPDRLWGPPSLLFEG
jgi:hypothetical protein